MNKKMIAVISFFLLVCVLSVVLPNSVSFAAGWVEKKAISAIEYSLQQMFEPIYTKMVELLGSLMTTKDLSTIAYVQTAMTAMKYLASCLLVTQFTFRIWQSKTSMVFSGQGEPYAYIAYKAIITGVLIYGMPEILNTLIKINASLITGITAMGLDFNKYLTQIQYPGGQGLPVIMFFIIWLCALVGLTISNAMRLAELCFLYVIGPLLAVSYVGKGDQLQMWIAQSIAVTFTQAFQYFMVAGALNMQGEYMKQPTWDGFVLPIAFCVLAIRGPQVIKNFLYSSGAAGASLNAVRSTSQTVVYMKMMKR